MALLAIVIREATMLIAHVQYSNVKYSEFRVGFSCWYYLQ
jgi:hypothetical protein